MPESGSLLAVVVLVAVLSLMFLFAVLYYRRSLRLQKQRLGLKLLASFRVLLTHVQQHRGLCNGYLCGGTGLQAEIEDLQNRVSRNFADISLIDVNLEGGERWQSITQHWARLAGNFRRLDPDNSLSQHNQLIKNILYLIDDVAREYQLLLLRNDEQQPLHLFWRELLSAAEYIGQARAIGTGVAAADYCDNLARIRLQYLCGQIESHCNNLWQEIGSSEGAPEAVTQLIDTIKFRILGQTPDISAADFFSIATQAIDILLDQFDQLLKQQSWN